MKPQVPEGLAVRFTHRRFVPEAVGALVRADKLLTAREYRELGLTPAVKGGLTECELLDDADTVVAHGSALCSDHDNYNRRIGRDIALGRALKRL
jgi:hypothetical protein